MTATKKPIPTKEELQKDLMAAQHRLSEARADVFDGAATADDLAKAEADVKFARARLEAVDEARYRRRHQQDAKRAPEIVEELKALHPLMEQQKERADKIRTLVLAYEEAHREIREEVNGAHRELYDIRDADRSKKILRELGVRVTAAGSLSVGRTSYGAVSTRSLLADLATEAEKPRKRPVAQRPPRRKRVAA